MAEVIIDNWVCKVESALSRSFVVNEDNIETMEFVKNIFDRGRSAYIYGVGAVIFVGVDELKHGLQRSFEFRYRAIQ